MGGSDFERSHLTKRLDTSAKLSVARQQHVGDATTQWQFLMERDVHELLYWIAA